jgi:hypothetical protein
VPFSCLHCACHFKLSCFGEFDWISSFSISTTIDLMADEKKIVDLSMSGFYEAMEKTKAEKIAHEMLVEHLRVPMIVRALM